MEAAEKANVSTPLIKRLDLSKGDKFDTMLQGVLDVANLPDPIGKVTFANKLDEGLDLYRVTCPIGVLLVIFESRPEVIANITALAIKSANAVILKGGKESFHSFAAISRLVGEALSGTEIPPGAVQLIESRQEVSDLLKQDRYIDLVIPRGSNELVRSIKSNTKIPVLGHADGLCSVYVHGDADVDMAVRIVIDSKTNYAAACNAAEGLLVQRCALKSHLPSLAKALIDAGVSLKVTPEIGEALKEAGVAGTGSATIMSAEEKDFETEFLSFTIAVAAVEEVDEAIKHINAHSSKHTDSIVTASKEIADKFLNGVDSSGVFWNASTRFSDGFRYGFGTEVGISTSKIHARGPVGLEGLTCYQYQLRGSGQVAADYVGAGGKKEFKHEQLDM
ncbi:Aldehyde/histidinol dehydrogenase [Lipomyces tetrasporus]|uniref:glutamate-5-semialdehyde dehydrogenase n=1 Tax=Lipomyces tetrasporus TaxID=54092 RepID=A0AAD7QZC5_9ASCO|nr:Aldehyde/histidinol dehydrogenase [Lipomyces tetrasporus]KAJ8104218.1 Aldehyde/histidinol dehydrogenase [Lipomyces tetrasporus]